MKIIYFRGDKPNFGDELNLWLWPKLLPDFFDDNASDLFLGIGSIIGTQYPSGVNKVIFGTGFVQSYNDKPDLQEKNWDVFFVRGPRTAKALGLDADKAVGDAAILIREVIKKRDYVRDKISFMPHWESVDPGNWRKVCKKSGIHFIDPTGDVDVILKDIQSSKLILTEAMHGAIVSDALRVPWVGLLPIRGAHRDKWYDWSEALGITLEMQRLVPSSFVDAEDAFARKPGLVKVLGILKFLKLTKVIDFALTFLSARSLKSLSQAGGTLSDEKKIKDATQKMVQALTVFKNRYGSNVDKS